VTSGGKAVKIIQIRMRSKNLPQLSPSLCLCGY
jgi:hypothetical protein